MNNTEKALLSLASSLPTDSVTEKVTKNGKPFYTTKTINLRGHLIPVPGKPGYVGQAQITFCVNIFNPMTPEQAKAREAETEQDELALLEQLKAKYESVAA